MAIRLDKLDVLFSRYVRLRADNHCEYCGQWKEVGRLQCSHFIGRRHRGTRWEVDNCAALCYTCHNLMHDFPSTHKEFFTQRIGSDRLEQLAIMANTRCKPDKEELTKRFKEGIKLLEEGK